VRLEEVTIIHQAIALIDVLGQKDPELKEVCASVSHDIRKMLMRSVLRNFMDEAQHQDQGRLVHKANPAD
jgi:hypothetical protein